MLRDGVVGGSVANYGTIESYYRAGGTTLGDSITSMVTNYSSRNDQARGNRAYGHNFIVPTIRNQGGLIETACRRPAARDRWARCRRRCCAGGHRQSVRKHQRPGAGQSWLYGSLQLTSGMVNVTGPLGITQGSSSPSFMTTSNVNIASKLTLDATVFNVMTGSLAGSGSLEVTNASTLNLNSGMWPDVASVKVSDSAINGTAQVSSRVR